MRIEVMEAWTRNDKSCRGWLMVICVFTLLPTAAVADGHVETAGDVLQVALPAMAYGLTFTHQDSPGRSQFYRSFLSTLGVTYALKYTIDTERPNGGNASFPSGHAAAAFSGASFMERRYGWTYGAPAYLAAAFVGWSRVDSGNHYTEDVLGAAVIGIAASYFFAEPYLDKMAVIPFVDRQTIGIRIALQW